MRPACGRGESPPLVSCFNQVDVRGPLRPPGCGLGDGRDEDGSRDLDKGWRQNRDPNTPLHASVGSMGFAAGRAERHNGCVTRGQSRAEVHVTQAGACQTGHAELLCSGGRRSAGAMSLNPEAVCHVLWSPKMAGSRQWRWTPWLSRSDVLDSGSSASCAVAARVGSVPAVEVDALALPVTREGSDAPKHNRVPR